MENKRKTPPLSTPTFYPFSIMWRNPHLSFPFPHISPPFIHSVYITILIEHQYDIPPFPLFPHHLLLFLFIFFFYIKREIYINKKKRRRPEDPLSSPCKGEARYEPPSYPPWGKIDYALRLRFFLSFILAFLPSFLPQGRSLYPASPLQGDKRGSLGSLQKHSYCNVKA